MLPFHGGAVTKAYASNKLSNQVPTNFITLALRHVEVLAQGRLKLGTHFV